MRARDLFPSLWLLALAACAPDFTPRSVLEDLRVLAVLSDPLEVGPGEPVTLQSATFAPPGVTVEERWSFCPFSAGSSAGYACAVPQCEERCTAANPACAVAGGKVTANPTLLAQGCLAKLGAGGLPPGLPSQIPAGLEVLFRLESLGSDGSRRETVQRLPAYPGGVPATRNLPPVIQQMTVGGLAAAPGATTAPLARGAKVEICAQLSADSVQRYQDALGRTIPETLVISFYTTAGRFDFDRANGPVGCVELEAKDLPSGPVTAGVWAVARDLRGGAAVTGFDPATGALTPIAIPIP